MQNAKVVYDDSLLSAGGAHLAVFGILIALLIGGLFGHKLNLPFFRPQTKPLTLLWAISMLVVLVVAGGLAAYRAWIAPRGHVEGCVGFVHLGSGVRGDAFDRIDIGNKSFQYMGPEFDRRDPSSPNNAPIHNGSWVRVDYVGSGDVSRVTVGAQDCSQSDAPDANRSNISPAHAAADVRGPSVR